MRIRVSPTPTLNHSIDDFESVNISKIAEEVDLYKTANEEEAREHQKMTSIRKPDHTFFPICSHVRMFRVYGMGLYMLLIKYLTVATFVMSIISIMAIASNSAGGQLGKDAKTPLDHTTLGNSAGNIDSNRSKNKNTSRALVLTADLLHSFFLLFFMTYFKTKMTEEIGRRERRNHSPS